MSTADPVQQLLEALNPESAKLLETIETSQREELARIYRDYARDLLDTDFEERFLAIITALVRNDRNLLTEKLSFLHHLESLLRRYFVGRIWPTFLGTGQNWFNKLTKWVEEDSAERKYFSEVTSCASGSASSRR